MVRPTLLCSESESDEEDCDTSLSGFTSLTIILVQCINLVFTTGFIVHSGDEEEIGDNDGDDEFVDDMGKGRKEMEALSAQQTCR